MNFAAEMRDLMCLTTKTETRIAIPTAKSWYAIAQAILGLTMKMQSRNENDGAEEVIKVRVDS
jgi:hypothetical protein